jgi:serine/threonine protein kinase/tetratricopeptide (TPR) repeat protein
VAKQPYSLSGLSSLKVHELSGIGHDGGDSMSEDKIDTTRSLPPKSAPPQHIGPFRILDLLGSGGMGDVYLAEQTEPIKRRVAIKVIKVGMDSKEVIARFESERQALAMMNHPNVAKIYDAGTTENGRPYFVMEHVEGMPITDYCDRHILDLKSRLELFIPVCQAIHHAHQKAIIHRDIKPSNILITLQDGKPVPKVIDFGVAKALQQRLTERTLFTEQGRLIGTPAYMSPEQAEMTGLNVDTTSDVYSLGVLLYELLVGELPFDDRELREAGIAEIHRIIRDVDPPKPSTKISGLGDRASEHAAKRNLVPSTWVKQIHGELDWITMRAMEKDRSRRYQSASAIGEDVERYLRNDAILAGPPTTTYRVRKFVTRNKALVAFILIISILFIGFGIAMSFMRGLAVDAREIAQARAKELELVTDYQSSMLREIDAEVMGRDMISELRDQVITSLVTDNTPPDEVSSAIAELDKAISRVNSTDLALGVVDKQLLSRAVETIEKKFSDQPLVMASLQNTVAGTYQELGLYTQAIPLCRAALELRQRVLGDTHLETLKTEIDLGSLLVDSGDLEEAEIHYLKTIDNCRKLLGEDHIETLRAINGMGSLLHQQGKLDKALCYCDEALEGYRRVLGDNHLSTLYSFNAMGSLLISMGKNEEALMYYRKAMDGFRRELGAENTDTMLLIGNVGTSLIAAGKYEEANVYCREAMNGFRHVLGNDHSRTLTQAGNMGYLLHRMGELDSALVYYREALAGFRRVWGENHEKTLTTIGNIGVLLYMMDRRDEALIYYKEALEGSRRALGDDHPQTLRAIANMGFILESMGKFNEAIVYYREALERRRRVLGDEHPATLVTIGNMGSVLLELGSPGDALTLLAQAENAVRHTCKDGNANRLSSYLTILGRAQIAMNMYDVAQSNLLEANSILQGLQVPMLNERKMAISYLVELYQSWNAAEPGRGFDIQAKDWQAKLDEL